jgi:hypothetical protein
MGAMLPDSQRHARLISLQSDPTPYEQIAWGAFKGEFTARPGSLAMIFVDRGDISKLANMKVLESGRPSIFFENAL